MDFRLSSWQAGELCTYAPSETKPLEVLTTMPSTIAGPRRTNTKALLKDTLARNKLAGMRLLTRDEFTFYERVIRAHFDVHRVYTQIVET